MRPVACQSVSPMISGNSLHPRDMAQASKLLGSGRDSGAWGESRGPGLVSVQRLVNSLPRSSTAKTHLDAP